MTDFSTEARFPRTDRLAAHDVQSGASVTIAGSEGNPFGVLAVYCKRIRCISSADVRFLQSVANVLARRSAPAQDQERKELLIGELRHRVGNLFSLVQALHRQTGQNAHDAHDLEMKFGARLAALASAHALILEGGWQKTSLRALLETTLAPYRERVDFPRHRRAAAGRCGLLVLDGAARARDERQQIRRTVDRSRPAAHRNRAQSPMRSATRRVLVWKECDGPPPPQPVNGEGFGSKLISQVVERQLSGQVTRDGRAGRAADHHGVPRQLTDVLADPSAPLGAYSPVETGPRPPVDA